MLPYLLRTPLLTPDMWNMTKLQFATRRQICETLHTSFKQSSIKSASDGDNADNQEQGICPF